MERIRTARWRLTFAAWSALLALWAIATIALDYDVLVLVRKVAGERGDGAIAMVGLVIGLPLLVDVTRNVRRGYRLWRRRAVQVPARGSWSAVVPASTPRTFRGEAVAELTRRERAIVEQGQLAHGRVEHHGELVSVRYQAPWGEAIASHPVPLADPPREGTAAPLLLEQGARVGVAPTLHGLEFLATEPEDLRSPLIAEAKPRQARKLPTMALHASLHPVERTSGSRASEVGELSCDGSRLTLSHPRSEPISLRLDRPFRVQLSTFLLPGGVAELNLSLEPQPTGAYRASKHERLSLKTELVQRRIAPDVEQAWSDACYLKASDFDALWAVVVAASEDSRLTGLVQLSR